MTTGRFWVLALLSGSCAAAAVEQPRTAIAVLAQTGKVSCEPWLPVFCSNIHVSCSGPTSIKTFPFTLRATRTHGSIESAADTAGMTEQYENGRVEWSEEEGYVILRPHQTNGYIKMLADGRYSFRHYLQHDGTMSHGLCN